jgi:3'-5' exoribonuclease
MGRRFIEQLKDGDVLDDVYLAAEKQLRVNKNGNPYVQVELRDRSGGIVARMWNAGEPVFRAFENGDFVSVDAKVQTFNGALQVILTHIERAEPKHVDLADFMPRTEQDIGKLTAKLRDYLLKLTHPALRALAECYLGDDQFMTNFATCPAGVKMHHAYVGGLLEHVVAMMDAADKLCPLYPGVDRDLVIMGIFLHDSGKTRELRYARDFAYTDEGQLIGHIQLGLEMFAAQVTKVHDLLGEPMPKELAARIRHMILSHHGTSEHGSPKPPMTPEAQMLHQIDVLDTRMHQTLRAIKDDRMNATSWTPYDPANKGRVFKGGLGKGDGLED